MSNIKQRVLEVVQGASHWLSTNSITVKLGEKHSTVGRALRSHKDAGLIVRRLASPGGNSNRKEWATLANSALGDKFQKDPTPPVTVWKKPIKKQRAAPTKSNGDFDMQIKDGVAAVIKDLVSKGKSFSAHDVTVIVRNKIEDGSLTVDPFDPTDAGAYVFVNGKKVTRVGHLFVKNEVEIAWRDKTLFANYERNHNGTYYEYAPAPTVATPTAPASTPPADGGSYDGSPTL